MKILTCLILLSLSSCSSSKEVIKIGPIDYIRIAKDRNLNIR